MNLRTILEAADAKDPKSQIKKILAALEGKKGAADSEWNHAVNDLDKSKGKPCPACHGKRGGINRPVCARCGDRGRLFSPEEDRQLKAEKKGLDLKKLRAHYAATKEALTAARAADPKSPAIDMLTGDLAEIERDGKNASARKV